MTQEEITKNSKLIAEFMGSKWINDAPEDYPNGYYYQPEELKEYCPTGLPEDWDFHSSWDWIMPVVLQINSKQYYFFWEDYNIKICRHSDGSGSISNKSYLKKEKALITVYKVVVDFIKWYNKNK